MAQLEMPSPVNPEKDFEVRLQQSSQSAFRAAYAVLRNHADAEDITQDAMLRAYHASAQLRQQASFQSWVARIAWRLALNKLRSQKNKVPRELLMVPAVQTSGAIDSLIMRDRHDRLRKAIDTLPPRFRVVTVLAGIKEYSIKDIAASLSMSEGTVKSRLCRARRMLRKLLQ
jgi:RNA polymerase sigma-70 factor (ECF subfamily)